MSLRGSRRPVRGKIARIDMLAAPGSLNDLDLTILHD
jgi:hypothetical protein